MLRADRAGTSTELSLQPGPELDDGEPAMQYAAGLNVDEELPTFAPIAERADALSAKITAFCVPGGSRQHLEHRIDTCSPCIRSLRASKQTLWLTA